MNRFLLSLPGWDALARRNGTFHITRTAEAGGRRKRLFPGRHAEAQAIGPGPWAQGTAVRYWRPLFGALNYGPGGPPPFKADGGHFPGLPRVSKRRFAIHR